MNNEHKVVSLPFTDSDYLYIAQTFRSVIQSLRVSSPTYTKYTVLTKRGMFSIQKTEPHTFLISTIPQGKTQVIRSKK